MRVVALRVAVVVSATALVVAVAATGTSREALPTDSPAAPVSIDAGAEATGRASRGAQVQLNPPNPPERCRRVVVVGDSLTDNARWWIQEELRAAGFTASLVEAHHSRRIPAAVSEPYSGVRAAWRVRATWGEADCWVIALGSNDLPYGGGVAATARAMLAEMLAAVTPAARVWWTNVDYRRDPRWSFDFVRATAVFNTELAALAASDPRVQLIDWYSSAQANPQWFFDPVHVDRAGSIARARQLVAALPR